RGADRVLCVLRSHDCIRIDDIGEQPRGIGTAGIRQLRADAAALSEELVTGSAVFGEERLAVLRIAGAGAQVVTESPHLGELLLPRARFHAPPVFADGRGDVLVAE